MDRSKDLVVDAKIQNEGNGWAGSGANPWHLDSLTESLVFLTDMSDRPARVGFKVWAGGTVYYVTKLKLAPHETRMIAICASCAMPNSQTLRATRSRPRQLTAA